MLASFREHWLILGFFVLLATAVSGCTLQPEDQETFAIRGEVPFDGVLEISK